MRNLAFLLFVVVACSGCLRGETKSLDQVFAISLEQFSQQSRDALPQPINTSLESVHTGISSGLTSPEAARPAITQIANELTALLSTAGYTVRPALTELRNQYLELGQNKNVTADQFKLLASRTYSVLSQELETNRFALPAQ